MDYNSFMKDILENANQDCTKLKERIDEILSTNDLKEVLAQVSCAMSFNSEETLPSESEFTRGPFLQYLVGVSLNYDFADKKYNNQEVGELLEIVPKYVLTYPATFMFTEFSGEEGFKKQALINTAKQQGLISQMNPNMYPAQVLELCLGIFAPLDSVMVENFGFTTNQFFEFSKKVISRYERLFNQRKNFAQDSVAEMKKDFEAGTFKPDLPVGKTFEDLCTLFGVRLIFEDLKDVFWFTVDQICSEEEITDRQAFEKWLETFSCKPGDNKFNFPLDDNIILEKPIINSNDQFIVPISYQFSGFGYYLLESLFIDLKNRNEKLWDSYQKARGKFLEDKTIATLSKMFGRDKVHSNLFYEVDGQRFEIDVLVQFDNKFLIFEAKSGPLTKPSKRGAYFRLISDLEKLVGKAFIQGQRTLDHLNQGKITGLKDKTGKLVLKIDYHPNKNQVVITNMTLEPLMKFAANLNEISSTGLYKNNSALLSMNIYEFEVLCEFLRLPSILFHYLDMRLSSHRDNVYHAFDEMSFLAHYLQTGNFYLPLDDEGKPVNFAMIDAAILDSFDEYYLKGTGRPEFKIEAEFLDIVRTLEYLKPKGYSDIVMELLDLDKKPRKMMLQSIEKIIGMTKNDGKKHDFSVVFDHLDGYKVGFTIFSEVGRKESETVLPSYCYIKKYQTKSKKWIGFGIDITDTNFFVNIFCYMDNEWEQTKADDELLQKFIEGLASYRKK